MVFIMSLKDLAKSMTGKTIRVRCVDDRINGYLSSGKIYNAVVDAVHDFSVYCYMIDDQSAKIYENILAGGHADWRILLQPTVRERV